MSVLRQTAAAATFGVALVLAATGCMRTKADAVARPNRARPSGALATVPLTADAAVVPAHAGGLDPRPLAWADGALTDGGRALLVRFLNRGTGCDWLDHVDVAESAGRVRVTVYLALNPALNTVGNGPPTICASPARYGVARASLTRPLRGRVVIDGAAGDVPRPVARLGPA
jgi:hypothetical protein